MPITVPTSPFLPTACRSTFVPTLMARAMPISISSFLKRSKGSMSYKGAYLPEFGDFDTAGAVNFRTRQVVKEGVVQAAGGQFDTQRYLLMFSPTKDKIRTLFAGEGYYTNGPFMNDNRYFRANLLGKMTTNLSSRDELSLTATFQKAQWNASGEIPLRAVTDGTLDRFGAIDPSEGGKTLRDHCPVELSLRYAVRRPVLRQCLCAVLSSSTSSPISPSS